MNPYIAELIGTTLLVLFGVGVCANVSLKNSYGYNSGWVVISFGWGLAVFIAVIVAAPFSGAHINPAVSIGLAAADRFPWTEVLPYILAQTTGAIIGASLAWYLYSDHYNEEPDAAKILGTFSTGPAIKNLPKNIFSEVLGTFVLIFVVLYISNAEITSGELMDTKIGLGSIGALPVALLVVAIGMSLGGTTGYAINPARDLGPRIAHTLAPIKMKGPSNWAYAWVPVIGPVIGALLAAGLFNIIG